MRHFTLSAITAALLLAVGTPALADVKAGVEMYKRGDYAGAIKEWRPLADRGDPDAQFNLAQAYRLGRGVPADLNAAMALYRKAATQDHIEASGLLGLTLFQSGKRADAMPWLDKAAKGGDTTAQYLYGTALFNGDIVKRDPVRAYALMTQAAAQGFSPARSALSEMDKHIPLAERQQGAALARSNVSNGAAAPVRTASNNGTPRATAPARDDGPPSRPVKAVTPPKTPRAPPAVKPAAAAKPAAPTPAPVTAAPMRANSWKVQLGAFAQPASASTLFASLKKRVGALAGAQPILVRAGAVTRLQAGPFASRAAATATCRAVAAAGQACFPVAP